jgi:hypothetical protein
MTVVVQNTPAQVVVSAEQTTVEVLTNIHRDVGGGAAEVYEYVQASPSASWIVVHNLAHFPLVQFVNDDGEIGLVDVDHGSVNQTTLTFAVPTSGRALFV